NQVAVYPIKLGDLISADDESSDSSRANMVVTTQVYGRGPDIKCKGARRREECRSMCRAAEENWLGIDRFGLRMTKVLDQRLGPPARTNECVPDAELWKVVRVKRDAESGANSVGARADLCRIQVERDVGARVAMTHEDLGRVRRL